MAVPVKLSIPSQAKYLCMVRRVIEDFLACHGVPSAQISRVALCVDEACSNIIKHSYGGNPSCAIDLSLEWNQNRLTIQVRDYGKACDARDIHPRNLDDIRPGGLGTHFINQLMDEVRYRPAADSGTLLTMIKQFSPEELSPSDQPRSQETP